MFTLENVSIDFFTWLLISKEKRLFSIHLNTSLLRYLFHASVLSWAFKIFTKLGKEENENEFFNSEKFSDKITISLIIPFALSVVILFTQNRISFIGLLPLATRPDLNWFLRLFFLPALSLFPPLFLELELHNVFNLSVWQELCYLEILLARPIYSEWSWHFARFECKSRWNESFQRARSPSELAGPGKQNLFVYW